MDTGEASQWNKIRVTLYGFERFPVTHGTKLVWNSLRSTFKEPSKRREAVIEETTWAINLFKFVRLGEVMLRFFLQMS